jgi:DNA polymerase III sliding clamp (beta) subunit (PCNA family)
VTGGVISTINERKNMNEITLPVSDLKTALPGFSKIIGRRSTLPVLNHIRLTRDNNGGVSLQATDLDAHAIYHVPGAQPGTPLDLLVPFEPLTKLVKGLGNQEVVSFIPEDKQIKIKYPLGGSLMEQKLDTLAADEFPPTPRISKPGIQLGPEFGTAIKQAFQCCSEDPSRYVLRGACLDVADKKLHYIVATNGRALFSANSFAFDLQKSVIIPESKFLNWTDLMDEGCKLAVEPAAKGSSQGYIQLASDRWTYITREIDGQYPNWKQAVPVMASPKTVIKLPSQAVKQLQEVLSHLPGNEDQNRVIRLKFEFGQLKVEGRSKENDWTGVFIQDAVITGKPVTIGLNREYLMTAIKFNLNEIQIEDALSPLVCINAGKRMVIMPVKLEETPAAQPKPVTQTSPTTTTPPESKPAVERKTTMPATNTPAKPPEANGSGSKDALTQIESVKTCLREAMGGLNSLTGLFKQAQKDKRGTEKEVASVRQTIKSLQGLKL